MTNEVPMNDYKSTSTQPNLKLNKAMRHRRPIDDPFFEPCDKIALQNSNTIAIFYMEEVPLPAPTSNSTMSSSQDVDECDDDYDDHNYYPCCLPTCSERFETIQDCENHYLKYHQYECQTCCAAATSVTQKLFFPNEYLLELHLRERHNVYFQLALERHQEEKQTPTNDCHEHTTCYYSCLVTNCPLHFSSDLERCHHLHTEHGYPTWFRFHSRQKHSNTAVANHKAPKGRSNQIMHRKINWWKKRMQYSSKNDIDNISTSSNTIPNTPADGNLIQEHDSSDIMLDSDNPNKNDNVILASCKNNDSTTTLNIAANKRKERKKAKNSKIPCRFYNSESGCWRGTHCMFLHEYNDNHTNHNTTENIHQIEARNDVDNNHISNHDQSSSNQDELITPSLEMSNVEKNVTATMDIDHEMDNLANHLQSKAKVSVPSNISFGRRRHMR